ncbi:hypothetical protein KY290_003539 [Solanum tuberosum]|uniref:Uncharacterized protein n=1 Tax=Solanum tuberosum TaxID=4113 RepID=A0ABQ7WT72_SOLTU|nr:hypothetical protein KY290_003539 [Solanum tuberosum]
MTSMKNNSQSNASKATSSKLSTEVEGILGVTFGSFEVVTRSKVAMLGQQTLQVSSALTPVFGSATSKRSSSSTNSSEGGISVVEKIKKTLTLLKQSGSKNSTTRENYDSTTESSPHVSHNVSLLKINLRDNPFYSPTSPMIMQTMVNVASSSEEQLVDLKKMEGLLDGEPIQTPGKGVEVQEIGHPVKKAPLVNEMQFLLKE